MVAPLPELWAQSWEDQVAVVKSLCERILCFFYFSFEIICYK